MRDKESFDSREMMLRGRSPNVGTKTNFRMMLLSAGWDVDDVDAVLTGRFKPLEAMADAQVEVAGTGGFESKVNATITELRKRYTVDVLSKPSKKTSGWMEEVWTSYTTQPWWVVSGGGQRSMVFNGSTRSIARASASFIYDVWQNLGQEPEYRMPVFRRLNLLSWASTEGLIRFQQTVGPETDIVVLYGGITDQDHIHQSLSYVSALSAGFRGVCLYEATHDTSVAPSTLLNATRRAGLSFLFGIGGGDG